MNSRVAQIDKGKLKRIECWAQYMVSTGATLRKTAKKFGVSKSCVYYNIENVLLHGNMKLYIKVRKVLEKNINERHIRGGMATKEKYLKKKVE